jgi:molybdopterin-guanine dinucleotide biosynthesis protein A
MSQRVGIILAGGQGRRLGRPKGSLRIGGSSLAERSAAAVWPLCGGVLISVGPGEGSPVPGHRVVEDPEPGGRGPLAGIDAAFRATGDADLLVLACDYPNVGTDLLRLVIDSAAKDDEVVMPVDERGRDHPLVALWRRPAAERVAQAVSAGRLKVRALLADLGVRRLRAGQCPGIDLRRALLNVNGPVELEAFRRSEERRRRRDRDGEIESSGPRG